MEVENFGLADCKLAIAKSELGKGEKIMLPSYILEDCRAAIWIYNCTQTNPLQMTVTKLWITKEVFHHLGLSMYKQLITIRRGLAHLKELK